MTQDLNTPMRVPDTLEGDEDVPLPGGMSDQEYVDQVNRAEGLGLSEKPTPPVMDHPVDLTVDLPVPIEHPTEGQLRRAEVRELNGEDEEYFAKGRDDGAKITRLVARGTVSLDGVDVDEALISSMPIGNRDTLMLAIRRATYGDDLDLDLVCNACGAENGIIVDLVKEVDVKTAKTTATVEFRRGGSAKIRWPNPDDESAIRLAAEKNKNMTMAELNSMLIGRVLLEVNGQDAFGEQTAKQLKMPDRRDIVDFLAEEQPGPLFDKIEHECVECGRKSPVKIGYDELFR